MMYPKTRTVLDIGGQDTKGIQVDPNGIVENFQMNDRCAAGCGRYLGYIADEMNMGLHELGPLAMKSDRPARINSTCTVFAGAELRDRLSLGEKREDILAGLHRAIILRAISIISRSGGVTDEFTFTGGVAKNEAAVRELRKLIKENYGEVTININPDFDLHRRAGRGRVRAPGASRPDRWERSMTIAAGIDVGTGAVKAAVFRVEGDKTDVAVARIRAHPPARSDRAGAQSSSTRCSRTPSCARRRSTTSPPPAKARACRSTPGISTR